MIYSNDTPLGRKLNGRKVVVECRKCHKYITTQTQFYYQICKNCCNEDFDYCQKLDRYLFRLDYLKQLVSERYKKLQEPAWELI